MQLVEFQLLSSLLLYRLVSLLQLFSWYVLPVFGLYVFDSYGLSLQTLALVYWYRNRIDIELYDAFDAYEDDWEAFVEQERYLTTPAKNRFGSRLQCLLAKWNGYDWIMWFSPGFIDHEESLSGSLHELKEELASYNTAFVSAERDRHAALFDMADFTLDAKQQEAVIKNDIHNLVIAGAGSGKTSVLTTRAQYLVRKGVSPSKILALAFNRDAATEIRQRCSSSDDVDVSTFHSFGKRIVEDVEADRLNVADTNKQERVLEDAYESVSDNPSFQDWLLKYLERSEDSTIEREDYPSEEAFFEEKRNQEYVALDGTRVKSKAERAVLNWFIKHSAGGDDFHVRYEAVADWLTYERDGEERAAEPDFYLPDHDVYVEVWAVDPEAYFASLPDWFDQTAQEYQHHARQKRRAFAQRDDYDLIEVVAGDDVEESLLEQLQLAVDASIVEKDREGVLETAKERYGSDAELRGSFKKFVQTAKTERLSPDDVRRRADEASRRKLRCFGRAASMVYQDYQDRLEERGLIDFNDMINKAVDALEADEALCDYDHVLVDEYQDMNAQRRDLIDAVLDQNPDSHLFAVGDDWQSINSFTGASPKHIISFDDEFPYTETTKLSANYRSTERITELAKTIISYNTGQVEKDIQGIRTGPTSVNLYGVMARDYAGRTAEHCANKIQLLLESGVAADEILILQRITQGHIREQLSTYDHIATVKPERKPDQVSYMSVHRSKGLEAKHVFIVGVDEEKYGFPCTRQPNDLYKVAGRTTDEHPLEEERRLFYVATSRAKQHVHLYTNKHKISPFIYEIKDQITDREIIN